MKINELMSRNRQDELKAVYRFITTCSVMECALIIEEIRCVHNHLMSFDPTSKQLKDIESVCINGGAIQLNTIA